MNHLFSTASKMASSVKNSVENNSYMKQYFRDYSDPSEYIDTQTAKQKMLALPLPPYCSWVNKNPNPDEPLVLRIHKFWDIFHYIINFLIFSIIGALIFYSFAQTLKAGDPQGSLIIILFFAIVFASLILSSLYNLILSFFPKFLIFDGENLTLTRKVFLYRDKTYNIYEAYIDANVESDNNNVINEGIGKTIFKQVMKNYKVYIYHVERRSRWRSKKLITVKSLMNGMLYANYFCDLIHIQRLAKK